MCENCIERTHLHKHAANKANSGRTTVEAKRGVQRRGETERGKGSTTGGAATAGPAGRVKMQLKNATVLHKSAGKAPKIAHNTQHQHERVSAGCAGWKKGWPSSGQTWHGRRRAVNMTNAQGTRVNRRYNLLIIRCACSACCCCSFTSYCSSSSSICFCCCHPCCWHCVALVWPAGSTSTTCESTKRHTSNPKSVSLAQICRKTLSNISWQRGRVTQGITLLAGSEGRGERGAQHELQKILQRHDSTLANVADAANTASVASPFYVAIFMSCWPENGDWY